MLAKEMMDVVGLIVFEFSFTRQQPERVWLHDRAPHPRFGANRAVAFEAPPLRSMCASNHSVILERNTRTKIMQNACIFSSDRRYRYLLRHTWEPLFAPKFCTWIGLNPSVADETQLDPTLRRIRAPFPPQLDTTASS